MEDRVIKLEGSLDTLKVVRPMTLTVLAGLLATVGVILAALVFIINSLGNQMTATNGKIDGLTSKFDTIPKTLSEEFRAMRSEMAAQTTAIANSITATRNAPQAPAPPQIIVVPSPLPGPTPKAGGGK